MANTTQEVAEAATEAVGHAGEAAQSAGMPQLDFSTFPNQIFWLAVALVLIYLILSKIALPRIGGIMADRQGTITNDIAAAEEFKAKAVEAEKVYNQALVDARADAQKIVAEARVAIQKDLDKATARADAEIAAKTSESARRIEEIRDGAAKSVEQVAKDTAAEIVAALGVTADAKSVANAVVARLKG